MKPVCALAIARAGVGAEERQEIRAVADRDKRDHRADAAEGEVAEKHALRRRRRAQGKAERDEAGSDIGAEHEGERERQAEDAGGGEGDDEENDGDARMGEPGEERSHAEREDGIAREALHHEGEHLVLAQGLRCADDEAERQDHERKTDDDAADLLPEARLCRAEAADAEKQENGHKRGSLERERLDDERRADIGAEHHGERRQQAR